MNCSKSLPVHQQQSVPLGPQVDFTFPGRSGKTHPRSGQGLGKGQGGFIFMHPVLQISLLVGDIDVIAPHAMQLAKVARLDLLAMVEGWPLTHPRDDLGHVVQGQSPHRLLHRHHG